MNEKITDDLNNIASSLGGSALAIIHWLLDGRKTSAFKLALFAFGSVIIAYYTMPYISERFALSTKTNSFFCFVLGSFWHSIPSVFRSLLVKK